MALDFEIFECLSDGSVMWCARASSLHEAKIKLEDLQRDTAKIHFALHQLTHEIIFAKDISRVAAERASQRIFHIAYADHLRLTRAKLLRSLGYAVISAMGNEAAKLLLKTLRPDASSVTLFIVGHTAPIETRTELIGWLKGNYPNAKVLALNPPGQHIAKADYNAPVGGPEIWLPFISATVSPVHKHPRPKTH